MNQPQQIARVPITREWRVRRPYFYRYLDRQFVDLFFNDGVLRLSTFQTFARHVDEQRQDAKEGWGVVSNNTSDGGGQSIFASVGMGFDSYVLCGSTMFTQELKRAFGTESGFRINDTISFANVVSSHIPGFRTGIEGGCIYNQYRSVERDVGKINLDDFKTPDGKGFDMGKMFQMTSQLAADDLFFLKQQKYAHQNEYRLLWFGSDSELPYIDIKCPEAVQFCTRFDDLTL